MIDCRNINNKYMRSRLFILVLFCSIFVAACNGDSTNIQIDSSGIDYDESGLSANKFTIWWDQSFGAPYDDFAANYLKERFKETEFSVFQFEKPGMFDPPSKQDLFSMLRSQPSPDLIIFSNRFFPLFIESEYLEPIDFENFGIIQSLALEHIREMAPDLELYALPFGENVSGLFYNKSIFDEMDVQHPTDGMTWQEVISLASEVSKVDKWTALSVADFDLIASQLSLRLYDQNKQQVDYEQSSWNELEHIVNKLKPLQKENANHRMSSFVGGSTAMIAGSMFDELQLKMGLYNQLPLIELFDLDWDVVSFPVFDDGRSLAPARHILYLGIPRTSNHKEDAQLVIKYLLSKEIQRENTRKGLMSLREDSEQYVGEFGDYLMTNPEQSMTSLVHSRQTGSFDPSLDDYFILELLYQVLRHPEFLSKFGWESVKEQIREGILDYLRKRSDIIMELQEIDPNN